MDKFLTTLTTDTSAKMHGNTEMMLLCLLYHEKRLIPWIFRLLFQWPSLPPDEKKGNFIAQLSLRNAAACQHSTWLFIVWSVLQPAFVLCQTDLFLRSFCLFWQSVKTSVRTQQELKLIKLHSQLILNVWDIPINLAWRGVTYLSSHYSCHLSKTPQLMSPTVSMLLRSSQWEITEHFSSNCS